MSQQFGRKITQAAKSSVIKPDTTFHHVSGNPEVKINKQHRSRPDWENPDLEKEGVEWGSQVSHMYRHKDNDIGNLSAFDAFKPSYWTQRFEVAADPIHNTKGGHARVD